MEQRLSAVSQPKLETPELGQYLRFGKDLGIEAAQLDNRFRDSTGVVFQRSRDKVFRSLLLRDLSDQILPGTTLRESATAFVNMVGKGSDVAITIAQLREFVRDSPLVSVDSIRAHLQKRGLAGLSQNIRFNSRLLSLYYQANVDENYVVAGLQRLDPSDPTIHPYDPDLFWEIVARIFGAKMVRQLEFSPNPAVDVLVVTLAQERAWRTFVSDYHTLRETADSWLVSEAEMLADQLGIQKEFVRTKLLSRIYHQQARWLVPSLASLFMGLPGTLEAAANLPTLTLSSASIVSLMGTALGAYGTVRGMDISKLVSDRNANEMRAIRSILRRELRRLCGRQTDLQDVEQLRMRLN